MRCVLAGGTKIVSSQKKKMICSIHSDKYVPYVQLGMLFPFPFALPSLIIFSLSPFPSFLPHDGMTTMK